MKLLLEIERILQSAGILSPIATETMSPGTKSSALMRLIAPSRTTLASFAEYSWRAAMAFSALVSCETPTTEFRIRIVRIYVVGLSVRAILAQEKRYSQLQGQRRPSSPPRRRTKQAQRTLLRIRAIL